jgi:hypothetical protein
MKCIYICTDRYTPLDNPVCIYNRIKHRGLNRNVVIKQLGYICIYIGKTAVIMQINTRDFVHNFVFIELTTRGIILLEKLTVIQLVKVVPLF